MHNSHFAAEKMKENVLNIEYHSNSLKTSPGYLLSIHNNDSSIWAIWRSIFDFWKKTFNFSFKGQKVNSFTFCAKISSDRQIWLNRHWNRVKWTLEIVFNTYHHTRTCLDEKIEIDEKISKCFFPYQFP